MAKKKETKPTKSAKVEGGTVTVSQGMRLSANYNSYNFDIGVSIPLGPGESAEAGLERADAVVCSFWGKRGKGRLGELDDQVDEIKRGR